MSSKHVHATRFCRMLAAGGWVWLFFFCVNPAVAQDWQTLPAGALGALHDLLDRVPAGGDATAFDTQSVVPLLRFIQSPGVADGLYHGDDSFGASSAFHHFQVKGHLNRIVDYILDDNIPSIFFWPSSLRTAKWNRVEGGEEQLRRLREACVHLDAPFLLRGEEHLSITPDQHTGAYYTYDVDKLIILAPYEKGQLMISVYRQQKPSMVGRKGWVLGQDDDWSYLYTQDRGLNIKGLSWVKTYMYDSFGVTVYWQKDRHIPEVDCSVVSWVNAGWSGINMVKSHHIHSGLIRVAHAFREVLENPRLPDPASLSATFARSRNLPTPTLRAFARNYFNALEQRVAASKDLHKKLGETLDPTTLVNQMNRDELFSALALDYLKKILGRDPVMHRHPF
ncbi:hypothetical protein [Desulfosarcina cetonica]